MLCSSENLLSQLSRVVHASGCGAAVTSLAHSVDLVEQHILLIVRCLEPRTRLRILWCFGPNLSDSSCCIAASPLQSKTMPPVPAHHLAWRGTRVQLDVQQQPGNTRLRVTSHSNEYVGLLRERIARQLGCGSKHVRLILLGELGRLDLGNYNCTNAAIIGLCT